AHSSAAFGTAAPWRDRRRGRRSGGNGSLNRSGAPRVQVWSLGSGSSGNAYLLRARETLLLVDCGLPLRVLEGRLASLDVQPEALSAVLVTHEHHDHLGGVPALVRRYKLPLYATAGTLRKAASRLPANVAVHPVADGVPFTAGDFTVRPFAVPH